MGSEIADGRAAAFARLSGARVARLGTVSATGEARLVPICFALDRDRVVSAVDHKPKTTTALARLRDIGRGGRATVLVERDDMSPLDAEAKGRPHTKFS